MLKHGDQQDARLLLFRDVLSIYKNIISKALAEYNVPIDSVIVKDSGKKNTNRAPLVVLERGDYQHEPRSLMFNESTFNVPAENKFSAMTEHIMDYPIEFTCYGNSYLESEKLGYMCVEALLTSGLTIIRRMHPNILGAELSLWTKTNFAEGEDSSLMTCKVIGKVTVLAHGEYIE